MRNVTVRRTKSFVGCLSKMKVYVEDPNPASSEILINNVPCRKVGVLRNGEELTFTVEEHALKVFVIADKLSKNFSSDFYQLPEGQEDVFLSGGNKFSLGTGNAFRFDNNNDPAALEARRKARKKGWLVLLLAVVIGFVVGYVTTTLLLSGGAPEPKEFSSNGMSVTLTDEFRKSDVESAKFTVAYESSNVAVFALREAFSLAPGFGKYTLKQYANLVLESNDLSGARTRTQGDLFFLEYAAKNPESGDTYRYFAFLYKTDDAFWMIQFATLDANAEQYFDQIISWAGSVKFAD